MSSNQQSLLSGDNLAQYRFTLEALVSERLRAIAALDGDTAGYYELRLEQLLTELRHIVAELRRVGPSSTEVPF